MCAAHPRSRLLATIGYSLYTGRMNLRQWVASQPLGAITRLQRRTRLSYTAVHRAVHGKSKPSYENATALAAATGGDVTVDEIFAYARRMRRKHARERDRESAAA